MKTIRFYSLSLLVLFSISAFSQTYSNWRGSNRDGHYPDKELLKEWAENGPEIMWHNDDLGEGYSSPVFYNEKIYISGNEDSAGFIYVLNLDGKFLWKAEYGKAYMDQFPNTRSTPVFDETNLYMYSGLGEVICMNAADGKVKWRLHTQNELDGVQLRWGVTENMLIDGDMLYVAPGGKKHNVIAINKNTGKIIWSSTGLGKESAYNSPYLLEREGRKLLVVMMASDIQGHDAKTGVMLWSFEQPNKWSVHANTPVYNDDCMTFTSGYGKGTLKLKISKDGSSVEKLWFNEQMDNRMGGAVKAGNYLYASGDKNRGWHCVNWETGESVWYDKTLANGVVITADNLLYIYSDRGELALVEATPNGFNLKGKTMVELGTMQHWAHPVINDGILYLRHGKSLIAYKIK